MDEKSTGLGGYGLIIFLILLFFIFFWGNGRGGDLYAANGGCGRVSNCAIEKLTLEESCKNYLVTTNTANATQHTVIADGTRTREKIDFYEYTKLRDQLADEKAKNMFLEGRIYSDAQFNAIKSENAQLKCMIEQLPQVPRLYAQVGVPCGNPWPTGCGTTPGQGLV